MLFTEPATFFNLTVETILFSRQLLLLSCRCSVQTEGERIFDNCTLVIVTSLMERERGLTLNVYDTCNMILKNPGRLHRCSKF